MRRIIAKARRGSEYSSPDAAIRASARIDRATRSIPDQEVAGQRINRVLWADSSLVLELSDCRFLNCMIEDDRIVCGLGSRPSIAASDPDGVIQIELETINLEWRRADVVAPYVGTVLDRLWFAENSLLIYVRELPILSCHLLEVLPDHTLMLFWERSD